MEVRELICIGCPLGCPLTVRLEGDEVEVSGNTCVRGADYAKKEAKEKEEQKKRERERRMQEALLTIKKKYGKNAVLRGMNFEEGATAKERNGQIGGHQA